MAVSTDDPELPTGTRLGPYRVERRLGAGGMGAVYLASHTGLNKHVVVKVLHSQYARSAEVRLRFVREGEAAARIRHPHVVDVTDVGRDGAVPYLVMEYLDGESLADLIDRQGALAPDRAVDIMLPVIDAVRTAHAAGVIHRDLKPDNLFLVRTPTGDPHPKVLDFGISRVIEEGARPDRTGTAAMLGTPAYMSPEQIESARDVDAASDQYALGVILYECLTGRPAFAGDSVYSVLLRVGSGQFDAPRISRPDIDPRLEAVVLRAMAYRREDRFPWLTEFGIALLPFASPRARMIWGTSFQPKDDHGPADTQLELSKAAFIRQGANTLLDAVQERDTTTIPVGRRRSARRGVAVGVVLVLLLLTCVAGWVFRTDSDPMTTSAASATTVVPPSPPALPTTAITPPTPPVVAADVEVAPVPPAPRAVVAPPSSPVPAARVLRGRRSRSRHTATSSTSLGIPDISP